MCEGDGMEEWKECRLGDICKTNINSYSEKDNWSFVNYLDTGNITENKISDIQFIDLSSEALPSRARRKVQLNDIIYSTVRPNQKHFGIIKNQPENFLVSTGFAVLHINKIIADPNFIFYNLIQNENTESLHAIAEQTTSAYPAIKPSDIENLSIKLPPLPTQQKIAAILSSLDDKIELNNKINTNLEQQAQALFKNWFVDFEPFGGKMPEGWKVGKLSDILRLKKNPIQPGEDTSLPYLPIDLIPIKSLAIREVRPNEEALSSLSRFDENDILIGAMRVYFHRVAIAPFDGITRTTCFVLEPFNPNYFAYSAITCNQDLAIDYAQKTSKGSTMPYAVWEGGLGDFEIPIPDEATAAKFNNIVKPLLEQIKKSYFENKILQEIRESLLPKLMNGETVVLSKIKNQIP